MHYIASSELLRLAGTVDNGGVAQGQAQAIMLMLRQFVCNLHMFSTVCLQSVHDFNSLFAKLHMNQPLTTINNHEQPLTETLNRNP